MSENESLLHRKHTQPDFWLYACAYISIGSGCLLLLTDLLGFLWTGASGPWISSVGVVAALMGMWGITAIENRQLKRRIDELESLPDRSPGRK